MQVWTTKKLKELFFSDDERLICLDSEFFEIEYLKKAGIIDIAVFELKSDFLSFLNNKKLKGIEGITILCDFRTGIIENLSHYNAIVLDVHKIGVDACREIIKFIIHVIRQKYQPVLWYHVKEINVPTRERDVPISSKEEVVSIINYAFKNNLSLIISFGIEEDGKMVTARSTCSIRDVRINYFTADKIKPYFALNGLKEDQIIKIVFPGKDIHYEGISLIRSIKGEMLYLDFPEKLFIERRRHLRIEPSKAKPVFIYVHIPEEPSDPFEVTDISLQGAGFISERDLLENGIYTFTLWIIENNVIIMSAGIIRYKQKSGDKYKYGVEFQLTEKDMGKISDYIRKREIQILENIKKMSTT